MTKKILLHPNPILKKKSEEVGEITPEIRKLIKEMKKIVMKDEINAALAAPQVGVLKKITVVRTDGEPIALINPEIVKKTKEAEEVEEGCLSLPKKLLRIKRWKGIEVEALNEKGEKIRIKATGFPARVLQHEVDHLNGILIIDQ